MKQLNLEQMGVQEMDAVEIEKTNGGWAWLIPAGMFAIYLYDNSDRFMEGFNEGINEPQ